MRRDSLDRLEEWKSRFGTPGTDQLEKMLAAVAQQAFRDAASLIRLHEALLFLRAYPQSPEVARQADSILFGFAERTAGWEDLTAFEEGEISGIAGTSLTAVFSYEVARRLAQRYPADLEIAWERYDEADRLGPVLARLLPLMGEDWPVEAHVPFREWIVAARPARTGDLAWLLAGLDGLTVPLRTRTELYESLQLPLTWEMGRSPASRSHLRLPARQPFCHTKPLLRRRDVSLAEVWNGPAIPVKRLPRRAARRILALMLDTSAMRYRELYGFSHPDEERVWHADLGRGVEIYFFGVPPQWRLPLRAYHSGMFFKNGVPAGYVELLSLFERAEIGFNLYYTFREGESAWLYARLLHLFRQVLGVTCFSVDPYQIGFENPEAVDSGAFWFYRKLGFRPVDAEVAKLVEREEQRMERTPGYRCSKRTLEKLARGYIILEGPESEAGVWDRFRIRNLALVAQRAGTRLGAGLPQALSLIPDLEGWTEQERLAVEKIVRSKLEADETRYLRLMQRHRRLRAALLAAGS